LKRCGTAYNYIFYSGTPHGSVYLMVLMSRGALCKGRHRSTDWRIPQISVYVCHFMLPFL